MSRVVAIHQPNFFPWLGFFDKLARADVFVYLDHYAVNPRNSTWTKKVRILTAQGAQWLTVPLVGPKDVVTFPLFEMEVATHTDFARKHLATIRQAYGRSPHFDEVFPSIEAFYTSPSPRICDRNIAFIEHVCNRLGLGGLRVRSSDRTWEGKATDLLAQIVEAYGGDTYLSGDGAGGYQDETVFERSGIKLVLQGFSPKPYEHHGASSFVPGLSIIDALMSCGYDGVSDLLLT
jgi:WbqC-like protein family